MKSDERIISIQGLEVMAKVGVPDEERQVTQRLLVDLRFSAVAQPLCLSDDLTLTIDYYPVSQRVVEIVEERPRKLIETLADELSEKLLSEFSLSWIELTIRKFILPQTEWVSVSIRRERNGNR